MRTVLNRVPVVQHQPAPVLDVRAQAAEHAAEDAFEAARDEECVTAAVTNKRRRRVAR